jgi:hypothetical protein
VAQLVTEALHQVLGDLQLRPLAGSLRSPALASGALNRHNVTGNLIVRRVCGVRLFVDARAVETVGTAPEGDRLLGIARRDLAQ